MELSLREWMFVAGVALIVIIGLDALGRTLTRRREEERLMRAANSERQEPHTDFGWLKELPNGGARVVYRDGTEVFVSSAEQVNEEAAGAAEGEFEPGFDAQRDEHAQTNDSEPEHSIASDSQTTPIEASVNAESADAHTLRPSVPEPSPAPALVQTGETSMPSLKQGQTVDWLDTLAPDDEPERESDEVLVETPPEHVLVIHVKATEGAYYSGDALLPLLLACDLRFGDLGFFHRHEQSGGKGAIQFSVANMLKPGVFDIDNMASIQTQGIVFFMRVPGPKDLLTAYEAMLETARALVRHLGGQLLDQSHSVLTKQAIEQDKLLLRDYARKQLLSAQRG
jgi:cell division protein ZipA